MKYTKDSPVEIILGVCDKCNNYVPFMRLATEDEERVYECLTCKTKHKQHINGKVTFNYLDDSYIFSRN